MDIKKIQSREAISQAGGVFNGLLTSFLQLMMTLSASAQLTPARCSPQAGQGQAFAWKPALFTVSGSANSRWATVPALGRVGGAHADDRKVKAVGGAMMVLMQAQEDRCGQLSLLTDEC